MNNLNNTLALSTANAENFTALKSAVSAFRLDMAIADDTARKARLDKRIADEKGVLSETKKDALKEERDAVEAEIKAEKSALKKVENVRATVVADIISETGADRVQVENLFRVLACFGNTSLSKYALKGLYTTWTPELEKAMDTAHSLKYGDGGAPVLGKAEREAFTSAKNIIKGAVRDAVAVGDNKYFGKVSVNLNNTDIGALHESYVTGVSLDYATNKKTGVVSLKSDNYVVKTRVRKARGKNTKIDASGFWAVAVQCIILHICK